MGTEGSEEKDKNAWPWLVQGTGVRDPTGTLLTAGWWPAASQSTGGALRTSWFTGRHGRLQADHLAELNNKKPRGGKMWGQATCSKYVEALRWSAAGLDLWRTRPAELLYSELSVDKQGYNWKSFFLFVFLCNFLVNHNISLSMNAI